jgi:hypothetical protein
MDQAGIATDVVVTAGLLLLPMAQARPSGSRLAKPPTAMTKIRTDETVLRDEAEAGSKPDQRINASGKTY